MTIDDLKKVLTRFEQFHLIRASDHLLEQVKDVDASFFLNQKNQGISSFSDEFFEPYPCLESLKSNYLSDIELGISCLKEGKTGCLLVAGGQGTRLGFPKPKGFFPITSVKKKTLFQLFAEKIFYLKKISELAFLPLSIMVSEEFLDEIKDYFKKNRFFGLSEEEVFIFSQRSYPFLDQEGKIILDNEFIPRGPCGNGDVFYSFIHSGCADYWTSRGIDNVMFSQVDNALSDPISIELLGAHVRASAQISILSIEKESIEEKVGLIVRNKNKTMIVEYNEVPPSLAKESRLANISYFCFSLDFMKEMSQKTLPFHKAFKPIKANSSIKGWKSEYFVFDALMFASKVCVKIFPRNEVFHPLKDQEGRFSLQGVREALEKKDRRVLDFLGLKQSRKSESLELSPCFYYLNYFRNKSFLVKEDEEGYIDCELLS